MNTLSARAQWCIIAVAIALFAAGVGLSRRIEPGVRIEAVILAGDTPALRFLPAGSGSHPIALLAHGVTASKESLFRLGEALTVSGFTCLAIDFPGHGESERLFSPVENALVLERVALSLGTVDVFIGHSMGAYAGAQAMLNTGLSPRLFIAIGALPDWGAHNPPMLLLAGQFDEAIAHSRHGIARIDTHMALFPWCDHASEPYDPRLVNAAVDAACATVGKAPVTTTCWHWRLAGVVLGMLGALGMALSLPELSPVFSRMRGLLLPVFFIAGLALTTTTWFDAMPHLRRAPLQIAAITIASLLVIGAGKLGVPRWSFTAFAAVIAIGCAIAGAIFPAFLLSLFTLVLLAGAILGGIAACCGARRDGDIAMAILVGYAIGQWAPRFV